MCLCLILATIKKKSSIFREVKKSNSTFIPENAFKVHSQYVMNNLSNEIVLSALRSFFISPLLSSKSLFHFPSHQILFLVYIC